MYIVHTCTCTYIYNVHVQSMLQLMCIYIVHVHVHASMHGVVFVMQCMNMHRYTLIHAWYCGITMLHVHLVDATKQPTCMKSSNNHFLFVHVHVVATHPWCTYIHVAIVARVPAACMWLYMYCM